MWLWVGKLFRQRILASTYRTDWLLWRRRVSRFEDHVSIILTWVEHRSDLNNVCSFWWVLAISDCPVLTGSLPNTLSLFQGSIPWILRNIVRTTSNWWKLILHLSNILVSFVIMTSLQLRNKATSSCSSVGHTWWKCSNHWNCKVILLELDMWWSYLWENFTIWIDIVWIDCQTLRLLARDVAVCARTVKILDVSVISWCLLYLEIHWGWLAALICPLILWSWHFVSFLGMVAPLFIWILYELSTSCWSTWYWWIWNRIPVLVILRLYLLLILTFPCQFTTQIRLLWPLRHLTID